MKLKELPKVNKRVFLYNGYRSEYKSNLKWLEINHEDKKITRHDNQTFLSPKELSSDSKGFNIYGIAKLVNNKKRISMKLFSHSKIINYNSSKLTEEIMASISYDKKTKKISIYNINLIRRVFFDKPLYYSRSVYNENYAIMLDIINFLGIEALTENGKYSLGLLLNEKTIKGIFNGEITTFKKLLKTYMKSVGLEYIGKEQSLTILEFFNYDSSFHKYEEGDKLKNSNITAPKSLMVSNDLRGFYNYVTAKEYLNSVENKFYKDAEFKGYANRFFTPLIENRTLIADTISMAYILTEKVNYSWSTRRWKEVHDRLVKKVMSYKVKHTKKRVIDYKGLEFPKLPGITLLTSNYDLVEESMLMHHCIGTSNAYIARGEIYESVFLRYERDEKSTIELRISDDYEIYVTQNSLAYNNEPSWESRIDVNQLIEMDIEFNDFILGVMKLKKEWRENNQHLFNIHDVIEGEYQVDECEVMCESPQ
tara:strand:+ start:3640 stop:5079 length:1440 start_codon:yes stop_codon:yes gene_type:complete